MRPARPTAGACASRGSTLLEVMVALVLLALLLTPIGRAVDSAVDRATLVRTRAAMVAENPGSPDAGRAWEWGPTVSAAVWRAGPALDITIKRQHADACRVGLWCDGWFLGEREVDVDGRVRVQATDLRDLLGGELLVRVRTAEGAWGPPWRSVVPDVTGSLSEAGAARGASSHALGSLNQPRTVVHSAALANPEVRVFPGAAEIEAAYPGLVFNVPDLSGGWVKVDLEGLCQSWPAEEGRSLDVYF